MLPTSRRRAPTRLATRWSTLGRAKGSTAHAELLGQAARQRLSRMARFAWSRCSVRRVQRSRITAGRRWPTTVNQIVSTLVRSGTDTSIRESCIGNVERNKASAAHIGRSRRYAKIPESGPAAILRRRGMSTLANTPVYRRLFPSLSIRTACCHRLGALSVRWMQPTQQQGRFFPSSSSSQVRSMRRWRVAGCLASSTQQMNSFRPSGVRFSHRVRTSGFDRTAA